jgi:hypothetical protein
MHRIFLKVYSILAVNAVVLLAKSSAKLSKAECDVSDKTTYKG